MFARILFYEQGGWKTVGRDEEHFGIIWTLAAPTPTLLSPLFPPTPLHRSSSRSLPPF